MTPSQVPEGHPGDAAWRLPVWRTLLKLQLVKADQLEPANALAKQGGFFFTHLAGLGVNPDKLLTAVAISTGLPSAPRHEVRHPKAELAEGLDGGLLRSLLASPFRKDPGLLHVAFVVPLPKERLSALPPHKAYVALETDIRDGLDALFPRGKGSAPGAPGFDPGLVDLPPPPPPAPKKDGPTAEDMKRAGLVETHIHGREELLNSVTRLKWVGAAILALLVVVKGASWIISASRDEAEKRGAELRQGMGLASVEAAKAQQRAMRPGGGGPAEAPLPVQTPPGPTAAYAGSLDLVIDAMAALDVEMRRKNARTIHEACVKVAEELRAYAPMAPSVRQMGPLANLGSETMAFCEREAGPEPPLAEWLELRGRIATVLKGD